MKYFLALLAGIASAVLATLASAVVVGIANIYLMEHGITWPDRTFNWQFISMSLLDTIVLGAAILALVGVFKLALKIQTPTSP